MDEFRELFFVECEELLDALASGLRKMELPDYDMETVHAVFRAVHSVKGGAAAFGMNELVTFAHRFETVLDEIRSDILDVEAKVISILHRSNDFLADLVAAARYSREVDAVHMVDLLEELDSLISTEVDEVIDFSPLTVSFGTETADDGLMNNYHIKFEPSGDLYRTGNEPAALLQALQKIGSLEITAIIDSVPLLSDWKDTVPTLKWDIFLTTTQPEENIWTIFEFVEGCCKLSINAIEKHLNQDTPSEPTAGMSNIVTLLNPSAALLQKPEAKAEAEHGATIRVNLDRVDRLMNMIGELVIKEAMLSQVIETVGLSENLDVAAGLDGIRQLADEIQDSVMAIRAQPLKLVFQRMHRILREASDVTGKPVRLITSGEQTEVDKTMIERLVDPLTHMIRNSVDHGLEDALTRERRGKPHIGTVTLSAAHRSGRVQIELSDDGGGINRTVVRKIAEERGLIAPGTTMSPAEIDQLLFLPGFSSKQEVSAISGRGVGLDVVRREIMALGGRVMIHSVEGQGTTFSIALPLTLAVLEGMLIQLCDQTMVLPITSIQETMRPTSDSLLGIGPSGRAVANRGDLIPIIDLGLAFGLRRETTSLQEGVLIVVETDSHKRAALHVDGIVDQRQVVIKSLEENYGRVSGVSAATILGDGKIALIIDPEEIVMSNAGDSARAQKLLVNG